jgi:hypothetical protein
MAKHLGWASFGRLDGGRFLCGRLNAHDLPPNGRKPGTRFHPDTCRTCLRVAKSQGLRLGMPFWKVEDAPKRPYVPPKVVRVGTMEDLTQGGGMAGNPDGLGMQTS